MAELKNLYTLQEASMRIEGATACLQWKGKVKGSSKPNAHWKWPLSFPYNLRLRI